MPTPLTRRDCQSSCEFLARLKEFATTGMDIVGIAHSHTDRGMTAMPPHMMWLMTEFVLPIAPDNVCRLV